ncbi:hypothetical protein [Aeromicrobium ginsengisoli]|uniref:hypothetical protein n=1 Tax=Aeromicrobium ginsengisoli TaxID=363867 RepID=UPI00165F0447|nr:hypothetical protein [Aeromicrobium ginsengisoli]
MADEELPLDCPSCGEYLYIGLGDPDFRTRIDTWRTPLEPTPVQPAEPDDLAGDTVRMHRLAIEHDQPDAAARMLYLFGKTTCPACRHEFQIANALTAG